MEQDQNQELVSEQRKRRRRREDDAIPACKFGFIPTLGYGCFACTRDCEITTKMKWHFRESKFHFTEHLKKDLNMSDEACEEIYSKITKDIHDLVHFHIINPEFIKSHQKQFLKSVGSKRYCYKCNCVTESARCTCSDNEENADQDEVECFILKNFNRREQENYKYAKPLTLFDSEHIKNLHPRYYEIYNRVLQTKSLPQSQGTTIDNSDYAQKINIRVKIAPSYEKKSNCQLPTKKTLPDTRFADLIKRASKKLKPNQLGQTTNIAANTQEKHDFASKETALIKTRFHQDLQTDDKSLAWPKIEAFTNQFYFNIIRNSFGGDIQRFCLHYHPVSFTPINNDVKATVALAPSLFDVLENQLTLYTDNFRRSLMIVSTFQEMVKCHNEDNFTFVPSKDSADLKLFVPNTSYSRKQITTLLAKVLHYTALVVQKYQPDKWKSFCELSGDGEKHQVLCKWIIHFAKIDIGTDSAKEVMKKVESFYGAFILGISLDLQYYRAPSLLMDADTPRKLERNFENMLLILRLVALTFERKEIIKRRLPTCRTIHELSSNLAIVRSYISDAVETVKTNVRGEDGNREFACTYCSPQNQSTTIVIMKEKDFQKACEEIEHNAKTYTLDYLRNLQPENSSDIEEFVISSKIAFEESAEALDFETTTISFSFTDANGESLSMINFAEMLVRSCQEKPDNIRDLVSLYNRSLWTIATLLYISFPSRSLSVQELSNFTIGRSKKHDKRPSIATLADHPSLLQICLSDSQQDIHYVADIVCKFICINVAIRHSIIRLVDKEWSESDLHHFSHFFFTELKIENHDDVRIIELSEKMVRDELITHLRHNFHRSNLTISHFKDIKRHFFSIEMLKRMGYSGIEKFNDGDTLFNHSNTTHHTNYKNPMRSAFGNKANSLHDQTLLLDDQKLYNKFGHTISASEILPWLPNISERQYFDIRSNEDDIEFLTLLYQICFKSNYIGNKESLLSVNEMLTGARNSIHIYACGFGKSALSLVRPMNRKVQYLIKHSESNISGLVQEIRSKLSPAAPIDDEEKALQKSITAKLQKLKESNFPQIDQQCGITLLFVPTSSLEETHLNSMQSLNLLRVCKFEMRQYNIDLCRFKEGRIKSPSQMHADVLVCTYAFASLHLFEILDGIDSGYIKDIVFDEAQSFLHTFLTFHSNLEILHLKTKDIPIFAFSGTVTSKEEDMLKQLLYNHALQHRQINLVDFASDNCRQQFEQNEGVYRGGSSVQSKLYHCALQCSPCEEDEKTRLFLICMALKFVKEKGENGDIIIFVKRKEDVEELYKLCQREFGEGSTVAITGKENRVDTMNSNKDNAKKWITDDSCQFAICTTAGSVGIDNEKCVLSIHVGTYLGMANYLQSASRSSRNTDKKGYSIFLASTQNQYDNWNDNVYTKENDEKQFQLASFGIESPDLEHISNTPLREMVGPHKIHECIKCRLELYFDSKAGSCSHNHEELHDFVEEFLRVKAFFYMRKKKGLGPKQKYTCRFCPLPNCTSCNEDTFNPPVGSSIERYFQTYVIICMFKFESNEDNQYTPSFSDCVLRIKNDENKKRTFFSYISNDGLRTDFITSIQV